MIGELEKRGITHGIDAAAMAAIDEAFREVVKTTKPLRDVLIAKGDLPENGDDARIDFEFDPQLLPGRVAEDTGRMDFRERGAIKKVKVGDRVAYKTPAKPGIDGVDVYGEPIEAEPGKDRVLVPMDNITVSEDRCTFTSEIEGTVTFLGEDKIGVFAVFEIPDDVDYSTGNLDMDGYIKIPGWIRSGFKVKATGDIFVGKGIEDAVVDAGANLRVQGGIVGKKKTKVKAARDIHATFIENASVEAGGNIFVQNSIMRSSITALGKLDVTGGKGQVVGGSVFAIEGVAAIEIGSYKGVETRVSVGPNVRARKLAKRAQKRLAAIRRNVAKLDSSLARLSEKAGRGALSIPEARKLARLRNLKREEIYMTARQEQYKKILSKTADVDEKKRVYIRVVRGVHEGTIVRVKGYALSIKKNIWGSGRFILNPEKDEVEFVR